MDPNVFLLVCLSQVLNFGKKFVFKNEEHLSNLSIMLGVDHLICRGAMIFLCDQTFFNVQLKHTTFSDLTK